MEKSTRKDCQRALGKGYQRRLLAAFSVIVDGEGLLMTYGASSSAISEVADAFREIREQGDIDF